MREYDKLQQNKGLLNGYPNRSKNIYCLIPGHGNIIDHECNQVLKNTAMAL